MLIRPSRKKDVKAISHVYLQTWQDTYLGLVPFGYLYTMSFNRLENDFISNLKSNDIINYVAEDDSKVIGFISGGHARQNDGIYNGEIYALYVLKYHQRQGVGGQLVSALAKGLNGIGIYSMLVWVLENNPYRRFYEKINGIYLQTKQMPFAGEVLDIAAYGWVDTGLIHC